MGSLKYFTVIFSNNSYILWTLPPFCFISLMSQHNSVDVMTGLQIRRKGIGNRFLPRERDFFYLTPTTQALGST